MSDPIVLVFKRAPLPGPSYDLVFNELDEIAVELVAQLPGPSLRAFVGNDTVVDVEVSGALPGPTLQAFAGPGVDVELSAALPLPEFYAGIADPYLATLTAALPALKFKTNVGPPIELDFAGTLPGPTLAAQAQYISGTARPTVGQASAAWQVALKFQDGVGHPYTAALPFPAGAEARFAGQAISVQGGAEHRYEEGVGTPRPVVARNQEAMRLPSRTVRHRHQQGIAVKQDRRSRFAEGLRTRRATAFPHEEALRDRRRSYRGAWSEALPHRFGRTDRVQDGIDLRRAWESRFKPAMRPPIGQWVRVIPPPGEPPCYAPSGDLVFRDLWTGDLTLIFKCERAPRPNTNPALTVVPVRRVYIVLNNVILLRVADNLQLPALSLSLSLDADSWTWGFSTSLPAEWMDEVMPSGGQPVELQASINGNPFRLLAEKISREREFGRTTVRVSGRGRNAVLDAPYAPVRSFDNEVGDRTALQLMGDVLTINGVPIGWSIDWALTDWLVPGGTWAFQGTHVGALSRIAEAAGGYLQPHPTDTTMRVLPRYPLPPWQWGAATPDIELPSAVTLTEGIEWSDRAAYNRVFVSGEGLNGILGRVTRAGTAGDLVAPMVTDALITHPDAARQRGISILSATGRIADISLRLPVLPETGVITPGKMIRYVDGATTHFGIVRSVGVEASRTPEVWQTIGVETHVA